MTAVNRNTVLFGALAVVIALYLGDLAKSRFVDQPLEDSHRRQIALEKRISAKELELAKAEKSLEMLPELQQRSLPSQPELARSRYQAWLLELVKRVDLDSPNVDSGEPASKNGLYWVLNFTVRGRGNLSQVVQFLYYFYDAGHLHKIRALTLTPLQAGQQIDLSVTIEALSLPTATRQDQLTSHDAAVLASNQLADYQSFVRRNLFRAGPVDVIQKNTVLTAITSDVRGIREAWFSVKQAKGARVVREGDTLEVEQVSAQILEIGNNEVIVEIDGQPRRLTVGKSLADAEEYRALAKES